VVALVITGTATAGRIVMVSVAWPVPPALVALRVTVAIPAEVGVPEIKPVLVFTESPVGSPEAA